MPELDRQYAIRLPSGQLLSTQPPEAATYFGLTFRAPQPEHRPRVVVFDHEPDAQKTLDFLRAEAAKIGVTNIGAAIVTRMVGPWGDSDLTSFLTAIEGHANGESS
ncbi:hypothetical protein ABH922_002758 [Rhodococcus sp. 27YEA15]|uniref:hypothetical protein n=1 Tax=Rhodococcus sp. 27YEA15 TaxID=3156259 RepID=UPI003C7D67C9